MHHLHRETFRVRQDECDLYGHLNNAVYLRYFQEAAFRASEAVGFGPRRFETRESLWLIRETFIEYLKPVQYGETLQVKTWIEGFRRVIARRRYEARSEEEDLVCQAYTDWVYLDGKTQRPRAIPEEMRRAFFSGRDPQELPPRTPFPRPSALPEKPFKSQRQVRWNDLDPLGHVNNAVYLTYAEDCAVELSAAYGWPMSRWLEQGKAFVARSHYVEYLEPAVLEDELEISTWLVEVGRATATRHYDLHKARDGRLIGRIRTLWVMLDLETGRPQRFPEGFQEILAPNIAG